MNARHVTDTATDPASSTLSLLLTAGKQLEARTRCDRTLNYSPVSSDGGKRKRSYSESTQQDDQRVPLFPDDERGKKPKRDTAVQQKIGNKYWENRASLHHLLVNNDESRVPMLKS